jgi:hypothetical protein
VVVLEAELVGDDSVTGQVTYVWLDVQFNESGVVGFTVDTAYDGFECGRGITPDRTFCI